MQEENIEEHAPRQPKRGLYQKTNAYTQRVAFQQVLTLLLFIIQLVLHSVFMMPAVVDHGHPVLWVLVGIQYALLLVIAYDYCWITNQDPVDDLILHPQQADKLSPWEMRICSVCACRVKKNSYHCMRCNRCTQEFDHHCKFLNNCIGSKNYQTFFRLCLVFTIYNLVIIGQVIWTLVVTFGEKQLAYTGVQWGILTLGILSFILLIFVSTLTIFHVYIIICQGTSTYNLMFKNKKKTSHINPSVWDAPRSAQRFNRPKSAPFSNQDV